ncbi:MAG TPA: metalloregulator ArsR/SmtB family transcription factor [Longimicrobiales bacterium]|nr:metalloregulator ArsR/SmtB family transcription factor [Longimicrobiales bacterium]
MNTSNVFHRLAGLADATRGRLLFVLDGRELTVGELVSVLQLPQSTVSRHLRILSDEGWLASRSEGTSRHYTLTRRLEAGAEDLWRVVRAELVASPEAAQDVERAREVIGRRRTRSQEFFSSAAGQWDAVRAELFGEPESRALLALLDPAWVVGDLGCGTGRLAERLAPFVARVVAVDESPDMLEAARGRVGELANVDLKRGRLEALPLDDGVLDVALLGLVLHYVESPPLALAEARRVLKPGGRLLVLDMLAHGREEYRERMGHVWRGFERAKLEVWLREAGLEPVAWHGLPANPGARGPLLFTAVAARFEGA